MFFLTTRFKCPDEHYREKLKQVLKYLRCTKKLKFIIHPMNLDVVKWYVDASYAIHDGCKGHTDTLMTLGQGAIASFSCKQKLNAKSSTVAELIAINEAMSHMHDFF